MKILVFDCEGDGLWPSKIHCLCGTSTKDVKNTTNYDVMCKILTSYDVLVGHNIIRWDIPHLERILGIKIKAKLVDTLAISWYLYPGRLQHGLEWWGETFGVPKPKIDDWHNLSVEEYIHRCTEDVKINKRLWDKQWKDLNKLYDTEEDVWTLIDYLTFKMDCAREQERSRWKLDVGRTQNTLKMLSELHTAAFNNLKGSMPQVPKKALRKRPKKPYSITGSLTVLGQRWFDLLKENSLPQDYTGEIEVITGYEEPNPDSTPQIKKWLLSLGWEPETYKYIRNKETNEFRKIEQVRKEEGGVKEICPSVQKLYKKEPNLEYLEQITVLSHRIGILKGFLDNVDKDGYIQAQIQGLTNTLRFKHKVAVNLPGNQRPYGKEIRACLVAPEGYELCGSDQSSLEDRTKQHFMWKHDPEYVKEMNTPGFDPHLDIGILAGMFTQKQADVYKSGDKTIHGLRHEAKQTNYSCTYGVTPTGLVRNTGMKLSTAKKLHATYWKRNWSLEAIAKEQIVKPCLGGNWLFNPVSKIWYSLRHEKDKFSTLNQGTGTFLFDMWVREFRKSRSQLTAQFHDEVVLCVKKGSREKAIKLLKDAVRLVNKEFKLNRDLDVEVQFGDSYAEIH